MKSFRTNSGKNKGFTIVELLIVISIVGILATITIIGYGAWRHSTISASVKSDLNGAAAAMESEITYNNSYPSGVPSSFTSSSGVSLSGGSSDGKTYCIDGISTEYNTIKYYISSATKSEGAVQGDCASRVASSIPTIPTGLTVVSFTETQVSLSWSSVAAATSYQLQCSTDTVFINDLKDSTNLVTSGTFGGLSVSTTVYCRVKAINSLGSSDWSVVVSTTTSAPEPCPIAPSAPSFITAETTSISAINVNWAAVACQDSFSIDRSTSSTFASGITSVSQVGSGTSYSSTGLAAGVQYYFRVKAVNTHGSSGWSPTATAKTTVPAPSSISATANSTTQITASWSTVSVATSYDLDYSTSSTFASGVTTVNTPAVSRAVTGLTPNVTYYFRVRAKQNADVSANSSTTSALTPTPNVVLTGAQSCSGAYSGRPSYSLFLQLQEVNYNLSANTSNVNWVLYRAYVSGNYNSWDKSTTWPWAVSINGSGWSGYSNSVAFRYSGTSPTTETISSGSLTVTHNTDGTKTISYVGSDGPGSSIFGSASCPNSSYILSDLR